MELTGWQGKAEKAVGPTVRLAEAVVAGKVMDEGSPSTHCHFEEGEDGYKR